VGVLAIVALAILGYLIFLLSGTRGFFRSKSNIYTYVGDSGDLANGAPVRLNGIDIGDVTGVQLSGSDDPQRVVRIVMSVYDEYLRSIPNDSVAAVSQSNLLSPRYMNITKGKSKETIQPNGILKSNSSPDLDTLFQQGNNAVAALQDTIAKINNVLDQVQSGQGTIGKFLVDPTLYDKAVGLVNEGNKLIGTLNSNKGTVGKLVNDDELYQRIQTSMARFDNLLEGMQQGQGTFGKILKDPAMYNDAQAAIADLRKTIDQANKMLADLNAGRGSAGKLLKSDEFANQLHDTLAKLDTTLDKVNSGEGTIGQMLVNPALYNTLDGTMLELHGLLKDFRTNPKKFLRIKLGLF
jgi:phospholipid/cholesterol/gamma-HCH transport system substrate-binding protein